MFFHLIWSILMHTMVSAVSHSGRVWVGSGELSNHIQRQRFVLPGSQLQFYGHGQNCLFYHLLCLTFKMMKHRVGDPWQDLFKEQPLGAREGWGVQSLAACWGIDQAVSQRPNAESPARREGHAGCAAIPVFEALSKTSAVSLHE